jgi:hypothetical protein
MNEKIRDFERQSGLEIYGLGKDRTKWKTAVEKYTELVVLECIDTMYKRGEAYAHPSAGFYQAKTFSEAIMEHFGVEE